MIEGGKAVSLSRDLTDGQQVQSMVDTVVEKASAASIFWSTTPAAIHPESMTKLKHAIQIWEWTEPSGIRSSSSNLRIPFLCINKLVPVVIKQGGGDIVSVSSRIKGRIASQMGAYAVAKGGIIKLT